VVAGVERGGADAVCRGSASEVLTVAPDSENRIDSPRNVGAEDGALKARVAECATSRVSRDRCRSSKLSCRFYPSLPGYL